MEYSYELTHRGKLAVENTDRVKLPDDLKFHLSALFDEENVMQHGYQLNPSEQEAVNALVREKLVRKVRQPDNQSSF